jgi:alpha-L-arabinofuranosidase
MLHMRTRFFVSLALFSIFFTTITNGMAQGSLSIYTDNLVNGFQDWSWASHNLANTSPTNSGNYSIAVSDAAWTALSFYHADFDTTPYTDLTFWAHGGTTGGQQLQVYVQYGPNFAQGTTVTLPSALSAGIWKQYKISLSSLGVANRSDVKRITIVLTSFGTTGDFYVDDIALAAATAPALVHLNVDATDTLRMADARWFGLNTAIWDGDFDTTTTSNALEDLNCQILRFPGGSMSDFYHWSTAKRADGYQWDPTKFANFIHVATNARVQAMITVNYGTGTSNEAAAWVKCANITNQCGFKYWEIGNECYGNWEADSNGVPHDPYTYAVRAANYIRLMKAADSTIKIGVVAAPGENSYSNNATHFAVNPRTGTTNYGWTPVMLTTLKNQGVTPDFIVHHYYPEYTDAESDPLLLQASVNWVDDAADLRQQISDYFGSAGTNIELLATENNSNSGDQGKQSTSIVNALYLADSLGQLMKTEFNSYVWWDLRNGQDYNGNFDASLYGWRSYGDLGIMPPGSGVTGYPVYFGMKMMQYLVQSGDTVLDAASDYRLLSAYAGLRTNGCLTLLVINKDAISNFTARIALTNFTPGATATVRSYGIPQDEAVRTNGPAALQNVQSNTVTVGAVFTNTFPPYSLTLYTFTPAAVPMATTVSLASGANPSTYGNAVTFTATVRTNGTAVGRISGETVTFYDGTTSLGIGTLNSSGQAAYTTTARQLTAGTRSVTAGYVGDANYLGSTNSPALSQTVNQATVTAGLTGTVSKNYDGTTAATLAAGNYTLAGVVSGDAVTLNNPVSGTYNNENQGTGKAVTVAGLAISGASAANYTLAATTIAVPVGTINKTNITVTAVANSKTYDGTTNAAATPTITAGSLQTGDSANFTESYSTDNAGTGKTLTPAGSVSDGNSGNNYSVTFVNNTAGIITARPLTVSATGVDKSYDGTIAASVTLSDNRIAGDVFTDSYTNASFATKHAGTGKTVSVSGISISGTDATNYTGNATASATGNIIALPITVTAAANSKTYDGTTNAAATPTITSGSVQTGDAAGFVESYNNRNVGTGKTLTPSGTVSDGNSGNNYNYTFAATANGTISAATLTYTANPAGMIYGAPVPALSGSVGGFVSGDTQGNATTGTLAFTTPATSTSSAGSYAINGSGLTANSGNYTFVQAAGNATALSILPLVTPEFADQGISTGPRGWQLSFSAQAGQTYKVLATDNLILPLNQWTILTNGTFGSGVVIITDSDTNLPLRFYRIVSP